MKTKITPAILERIACLRAPYRARLREIVRQLGDDPDNHDLIREADSIRVIYFKIERSCLGSEL